MPNMAVERTGHTTGFFHVQVSVGCGPPLTPGVSRSPVRPGSAGMAWVAVDESWLVGRGAADQLVGRLCVGLAGSDAWANAGRG